MGPFVTTTHLLDGHEVRAGLRLVPHTTADAAAFRFFTVCDSVDTATGRQMWHSEVSIGGQTVLRTASVDDATRAGRLAEAVLTEKMKKLLAD